MQPIENWKLSIQSSRPNLILCLPIMDNSAVVALFNFEVVNIITVENKSIQAAVILITVCFPLLWFLIHFWTVISRKIYGILEVVSEKFFYLNLSEVRIFLRQVLINVTL